MLEGVEYLILAEIIQTWFKNQDVDNKNILPLKINKIYDKAIFRFTPINIDKFNHLFGLVNYKNITTHGKNIFIPSINGYCLRIHLGKCGSICTNQNKFTQFIFSSSYDSLCYNDPRKYSNVMLFNKNKYPRNLDNILRNSIDWRDNRVCDIFIRKVRCRKIWEDKPIKELLINQHLISGIGNVYACEALLESKTDPRLTIKSLSDNKLKEIILKCQQIMKKSYDLGGMGENKLYSIGKPGYSKNYLKIYNKDGRLCPNCYSGIIQKIIVHKNNTFFCPVCQKEN